MCTHAETNKRFGSGETRQQLGGRRQKKKDVSDYTVDGEWWCLVGPGLIGFSDFRKWLLLFPGDSPFSCVTKRERGRERRERRGRALEVRKVEDGGRSNVGGWRMEEKRKRETHNGKERRVGDGCRC